MSAEILQNIICGRLYRSCRIDISEQVHIQIYCLNISANELHWQKNDSSDLWTR